MRFYLFWTLIFSVCVLHAQEVLYEGTAYLPDGKVAYIEKHRQLFEEEKIVSAQVEYWQEDGTLIAKVHTDFKNNHYTPDYQLWNYRRDKEEKVCLQSSNVSVTVRPSRKTSFTTKPVEGRENPVIGAGLFFFLLDKIESISPQEAMKAHLLLASRFKFYPIQISKHAIQNRDDLVVMQVKAAGWIASLVTAPSQFLFDTNKKRLVSYEGLSNIRDEHGRLQKVHIIYRYP